MRTKPDRNVIRFKRFTNGAMLADEQNPNCEFVDPFRNAYDHRFRRIRSTLVLLELRQMRVLLPAVLSSFESIVARVGYDLVDPKKKAKLLSGLEADLAVLDIMDRLESPRVYTIRSMTKGRRASSAARVPSG